MRKKLLRSRSGFEKPESREEAIMQNILGASNVLEPSESNIEEILKSILYNTPYTKEAEFEIEKILLAIKNNGTYDGEGENRDMKILIAILNDLNYTEEAESRIEELFIEWLNQRSSIKVLEGVPPLTFTSHGLPLINYLIEGNTVQSGTPTPDSPIIPQGTGDLETVGIKAGQYKIPISSANATTPVYLGEVETTRQIKELVFSSSQNWKLQSINSHGIANFYITITKDFLNISSVISNYFTRQTTAIADTTTEGMLIALSNITATVYIRIKSQTASTEQEFKDWLDSLSEEAAIWYVLATETTGIVNEPLMKIGDYADTLSMEQAGVSIPTANGSTTLDVDTTVKPSNIYIEYK